MSPIHLIDLDHIKDAVSRRTDKTLGNKKRIKKTTSKSRQTDTQKIKDQATRTLLKTGWGN